MPGLWRSIFGPSQPQNSDLVSILVAELSEARRDAVAMARESQATLDRIVSARFDRPAPLAVPQEARQVSPLDVADPFSDRAFLGSIHGEDIQ